MTRLQSYTATGHQLRILSGAHYYVLPGLRFPEDENGSKLELKWIIYPSARIK